MSSNQQKLRLAGAFAALATLTLAVSCTGFFVNPTLTTLTVGPASPLIETGSTGNTVQMTAFGTYNDGSTGNPAVTWSLTPTGIATISTSGLVTSVAEGTATVTATSTQNPSISGTQSLTVTVGCITSITIAPTSGSITANAPTTSFTATAATCNGSQDITSVATWTSSNTAIATVSGGVVTATAGNQTNSPITITASAGGINSAPVTITVSGF